MHHKLIWCWKGQFRKSLFSHCRSVEIQSVKNIAEKYEYLIDYEEIYSFSNINLNLSPKSDLPSSEHWAALGYVQVPFETRASHISLVNIPVPHVSGQHRLTSFAHDPERSTHMLPAPSHLLPGPQFGVDARHSSLFLGTHAYWEIEEIAMKSFFGPGGLPKGGRRTKMFQNLIYYE